MVNGLPQCHDGTTGRLQHGLNHQRIIDTRRRRIMDGQLANRKAGVMLHHKILMRHPNQP
jgi:predicted RNA binding protein with dsRBD fold (UPF0201 family)